MFLFAEYIVFFRCRHDSIWIGILIHTAIWPQEIWAENWVGLCPFGEGELGPYLTQCGEGRGLPTCQVCSERELAVAFPSVVCLSSVTFVRPTQAVQIFGNISTALGTLAIRRHPLKILWRS